MRQWLIFGLLVLGCTTSISCSSFDTTDLQGAGATFPAPVYKRWFLEYYLKHPEIRVNYQAIGSGAGIRQFSSDLVDFGASDAAMSDKDIATAMQANPGRGGVLMLPVTAGSVIICYNVPGVPTGLKLSRQVYADIFVGNIIVWNDPAIVALNPGVSLPELPITVVRRADSSGTTFVFTNHLAAISNGRFEQAVGKPGKSVGWPVSFIGGKGNAGVAALIDQTPGSIGYLEFGYAELLNMPVATLENKAGRYVIASLETAQAALSGLKLPADLRLWITDPQGENAYPIVTYTWILCWKDYGDKKEKAEALKKVLRYCLTDGQKFSAELGYIPLPSDVAVEVLQAVESIKP
ncbi:MAG: phosphate ABC transporter substrate-binding protein PstS [Gemmataceae bacterium]